MKKDWRENASVTSLLLSGSWVELEIGIYSVKTGDGSKTLAILTEKFRSIFMIRKN